MNTVLIKKAIGLNAHKLKFALMGYVDSVVFCKHLYPNAWEQVWVEYEKKVVNSHFDALPQDKYFSNT